MYVCIQVYLYQSFSCEFYGVLFEVAGAENVPLILMRRDKFIYDFSECRSKSRYVPVSV